MGSLGLFTHKRSERIIVTGCKHETVGDIVRGDFNLHSDNHGKPVYKKNGQAKGWFLKDCLTYRVCV